MPAPAAPFVGFALGVLFAWAASDELGRRAGSALGSVALGIVLAFSLLVYAPINAYFLAFWPDWSFAYLIETRRLPAITDVLLVLIAAGSCLLGFVVSAKPAAERRITRLLQLAGLCLLPAAAFVLATLGRLARSASYAQFHGDFGIRPVVGSALGFALLWMTLVLVGSVIWTTRGLLAKPSSQLES